MKDDECRGMRYGGQFPSSGAVVYAAQFPLGPQSPPEVFSLSTAASSPTLLEQLQALKQQMATIEAKMPSGEIADINALAAQSKATREEKGFVTNWRNVPEKLMLCVTELGEAMEAYRKLPLTVLDWLQAEPGKDPPPPGGWIEYTANFEEELADTIIRLLDLTASLKINIVKAINTKMETNRSRPMRHGKER